MSHGSEGYESNLEGDRWGVGTRLGEADGLERKESREHFDLVEVFFGGDLEDLVGVFAMVNDTFGKGSRLTLVVVYSESMCLFVVELLNCFSWR